MAVANQLGFRFYGPMTVGQHDLEFGSILIDSTGPMQDWDLGSGIIDSIRLIRLSHIEGLPQKHWIWTE